LRSIFILLLFVVQPARSQTLGGRAAYNFLQFPPAALLTAAGGINTSYASDEVGFAMINPALLSKALHQQVNLSFNDLPAAINGYNLSGALHSDQLNTTFGGNIYFVDYGSIPRTDAAGNQSGNFEPVDFAVKISASRRYLEKWTYGGAIKFIHSGYDQYRSSAIAFDAGILYNDTAGLFSISVLAKNMGVQLSNYTEVKEDLPFDLQLGITKKLADAPLGFSITAHHIHRFDISYNDTVFNNDNSFQNNRGFVKKLSEHFVLASHIYLGKHLEATIGYNRLRRSELNIGDQGNGLNGFSAGIRIIFNKLQVQFARAAYQRNVSYNQLGLTLHLNRLFGL
jgi:hypothetical protein